MFLPSGLKNNCATRAAWYLGWHWGALVKRVPSPSAAGWPLAPECHVSPPPPLFLEYSDFPPDVIQLAWQYEPRLLGAWDSHGQKASLMQRPTGCGSLVGPKDLQDPAVQWRQADRTSWAGSLWCPDPQGWSQAVPGRLLELQVHIFWRQAPGHSGGCFFFFFLQKLTTDKLREFVLVLNTPGTKSFLKES